MGIIGILAAILIFGIIVLVHEFGHYIAAKLSGCAVSKFFIGWGPKIFSFKRKETEYGISCTPLIGGYVKMPGMAEDGGEITDGEIEDIKKYNLKTFEEIKTWQKFMVFIGGVGLQIITCVLILTVVISVMGKPVSKVGVGGIKSGSPAEVSGLTAGDIILDANGQKIGSVEELINFTSDKAGTPVLLNIKRQKEIKTVTVIPEYSAEEKRALMGINIAPILDFDKQDMKWNDYLFGGVVFTGKLTAKTLEGLWMLVTHQISLKNSAMGPVRMVAFTKDIVKTGIIPVLLFFALINLNLAVINLIPFPALDGGHVLILALEKIIRIKIKTKIKEIINTAGFALLIGLMLYITYNDISWLVKSHFSKAQTEQSEKLK